MLEQFLSLFSILWPHKILCTNKLFLLLTLLNKSVRESWAVAQPHESPLSREFKFGFEGLKIAFHSYFGSLLETGGGMAVTAQHTYLFGITNLCCPTTLRSQWRIAKITVSSTC